MTSFEAKFTNECQIKMKWRIKEDVVRNIQDGCLKTPKCPSNIPGVKYYLQFFPNDKPEVKAKVFLQLDFAISKKIIATFTVSVKSASTSYTICTQVYEKSTGWGKAICEYNHLFDPEKKFFVNGVMEIELEGTLKSQGIKRKSSEPLRLAKILWDDDPGKDLTITVEGEQLKVHKWILSAQSPVFKAELESNMIEAQENKITITDFTLEIVKLAIEYCYEQDIKERIDDENVSKLLQFSDKYNIQPLHNLIQNVYTEKISETNVCKIANIAVKNNAYELREYCISFLMKFAGKNTVIDGAKDLVDEITDEIGRRCLFSSYE